MNRNLEFFIRRIREELRAEGPDGQGYSDFLIMNAVNDAMYDLSELYPIRDTLTLETTAGTNTYNLSTAFPETDIVNIIHVVVNNVILTGIPVNQYLGITDPTEGAVGYFVVWGNDLMLTGEILGTETVQVWVSRLPRQLSTPTAQPELPSYMDTAICYYAIATCYRESRDYERAAYYTELYTKERAELLRRGVPQKQRSYLTGVRNVYSEAVTQYGTNRKSDTNPSGE